MTSSSSSVRLGLYLLILLFNVCIFWSKTHCSEYDSSHFENATNLRERKSRMIQLRSSTVPIDTTSKPCMARTLRNNPRRDQIIEQEKDKKRLFFVHVKHPVPYGTQQKIEQHIGSSIVSYIPENTFLVMCTLSNVLQLSEQVPEVLWVGEYQASQKMDPEIYQDSISLNSEKVHKGQLHVTITHLLNQIQETSSSSSSSNIKKLAELWKKEMSGKHFVQSNEISVIVESESSLRITIPASETTKKSLRDVVSWIAQQPETRWIELVHIIKALNHHGSKIIQTGSYSIGEGPFHKRNLKGQGQIIGVADSGIDYSNCFFIDWSKAPKRTKITKQWDKPWSDYFTPSTVDTSHRKIVGYLAWGGSPQTDFNDHTDGHGTHVVGSILGKCALVNHQEFNGAAPESKVAFMDAQENLNGQEGQFLVIQDVEEATMYWPHFTAGARIHSHSWGEATSGYTRNSRGFDAFLYKYNTSTALVAGGNSGNSAGPGSIGAPATAKNVIAVGASTNAYENFKVLAEEHKYWASTSDLSVPVVESNAESFTHESVASFSSRGPTGDGRTKPDILAPGMFVISAKSDGNSETVDCNFSYDNGNQTNCPNDCSGKGTCQQSEFGYTCNCQSGYCGNDCSIFSSSKSVCCPNNCGTGFCTTISPFYCNCPQTRYGTGCQSAYKPNTNRGFDTLVMMQGTSMATPLAAGMASIIRQYFMEGFYPTGTKVLSNSFEPTNALIKAAMINSARPVKSVLHLESDFDKFSDFFLRPKKLDVKMQRNVGGYGLIGLTRTLKLDDSNHDLYLTQSFRLSTGEKNDFCFSITANGEFKATLVWTDPPGDSNAAKQLVNDLDLEVLHNNKLHYGNGKTVRLREEGEIFEIPDEDNNAEEVHLKDVKDGDNIRLTVRGYNVPVDAPQAYALVVTGKFSGPLPSSTTGCPICHSRQKLSCSDSGGMGYRYCTADGSAFGGCVYNSTCGSTPTEDVPGTQTSLNYISMDEGATSSFNLRLRKMPTQNVACTINAPISGARARIKGPADSQYAASIVVQFTPSNFNLSQTVMINHERDFKDLGDLKDFITTSCTSSDPNYAMVTGQGVELRVREVDTASISNSNFNFQVQETNVFISTNIKLNTKPTAPVTVQLVSSEPNLVRFRLGEVSNVSNIIIQFTSENYNQEQKLDVFMISTPPLSRVIQIMPSITSADSKYNKIPIAPLVVSVTGVSSILDPGPTPTPTPGPSDPETPGRVSQAYQRQSPSVLSLFVLLALCILSSHVYVRFM